MDIQKTVPDSLWRRIGGFVGVVLLGLFTLACGGAGFCEKDPSSLARRLANVMPDATITDLEPEAPFLAICEVLLEQPLDHQDADGNHFTFLRTFPEETQQELITLVERWINTAAEEQ